MNLFDLVALGIPTPKATAPEWSFGCFRRRSITFHTGATDTSTQVLWLQSGGLTADLRIYAGRPVISSADALATCAPETLLRLAEAEGGLAHTRWDGERMQWERWTAFQTHAKWPEAGILRRVGDCLMEFAPSGAYVEDWRLQASGAGALIGLELVDEIDASTGRLRHRGGGLLVVGRHAAFVRGRADSVDEPLLDFARRSAGDAARIAALFGFEASYGTRASDGEDFTVTASTSPWREGHRLVALHGFSFDQHAELVIQRVEEDGALIERRFRADTLLAAFDAAPGTYVDAAGREWLERESDTLLRSAGR